MRRFDSGPRLQKQIMKFADVLRTLGAPCLAALLFPASFLHGGLATATVTKYRGFAIDESAVPHLADREAVQASTREQIDIVCAVGLPPEVLAFLQREQFVLVPAGTLKGDPGLYDRRDKSVKISADIVRIGHKPVLLHELLCAFHDQRLEGGFANPAILSFYEQAKAIPAFPAGSHMMSSQADFFACSATTFLFGVTAQEPFQREKIKAHQPEFFAYLQKLFGPNAGNYAGSLTAPTGP